MASPPIPPSLEHLMTRPFSFYPPIIGVEHNEWLFRKTTWSEILVVNCKSGSEIWIPRRFMGEVSRIEDPVLIVGLTRELEYKAGAVWPYQRRVIEMPVAVGGSPPPAPESERIVPAPVVGIRLESNDRGILKLIGVALVLAVVGMIVAANWNRIGEPRQRTAAFTARDEMFTSLRRGDDYLAVVQKLGAPALDRWKPDSSNLQFRALSYPDRKYTIILMGPDRNSALYIGTVDDNWKPMDSVPLHSGGDTSSLLRNLRRF
jgi:hypothetical protein